jgi:ASC-1-like (ASCH) protein
MTFSVGSAAVYSMYRWSEKREYLKEDLKNSLIEGGIKNKQIHRDLAEYEKVLLERFHKESGDRKYDLDRRSPVFKVQGPLYKQEGKPDKFVEVVERWFVKGIEITAENYPPIKFQDFIEGEELVVEFSPRSHYVWDVYRIAGRARNWFMYLDPQVFDQLLISKSKKIIGRAPFGNHNLDEIDTGDIITFKHFRTGRGINAEVTKIARYSTVGDMIDKEGLATILPAKTDKGELIKYYESFYKQRIEQGGIYAFTVERIPS